MFFPPPRKTFTHGDLAYGGDLKLKSKLDADQTREPTPKIYNAQRLLPSLTAVSNPLWSPNNVPPEIWSYIFELSALFEEQEIFEEDHGPIWGRKTFQVATPFSSSISIEPRTPTTVSQVCGLWRDISFSIPEIWGTLKISTAPFQYVSKLSVVGEVVAQRLRHALGRPLTISIIAPHSSLDETRMLLKTVSPFHSQWASISLQVPPQALSEFSFLQKGDTPLLTSIKLSDNTNSVMPPGQHAALAPMNEVDPNFFHVCDVSSALRRLLITAVPSVLFTASFCPYLHEVNIRQSPSETWATLRFLAMCPQLRVLTLSGYGVTMDLPIPLYSMVVLPELETLNMEHPTGRRWVIQLLRLPKLRNLWLGGRCDGQSSVQLLHDMAELLKRSSIGSLESLSLELETHKLNVAALIDFLVVNPSLRKLTINDASIYINSPLITTELLESLTLPDYTVELTSEARGTGTVCPLLTQITLKHYSISDNDEVLWYFLKSRAYDFYQCQEDITIQMSALKVVEITCRANLKQKLIGGGNRFKRPGFWMDVTGA